MHRLAQEAERQHGLHRITASETDLEVRSSQAAGLLDHGGLAQPCLPDDEECSALPVQADSLQQSHGGGRYSLALPHGTVQITRAAPTARDT